MSRAIFDKNEIAFQSLLDEFNTAYQRYSLTQSKEATLEILKTKLKQAEDKLNLMKLEFKHCQSTLKAELETKLKQHLGNFSTAQKNLISIEQAKSIEQSQPSLNLDNRRRQEKNTNELETQTNQLQDCHKVLVETEDLQVGLMKGLDDQKKKLLIGIEGTDDIRKGVKETGRNVRDMENRELFSKALKLGLIGVLTLGNLMLIYYKI
ncbi:unnamed protein product (macronuclear) [Paramecium tetraurelia]|uniref:Vesicle transport v-SNARE N-terminal domain-containing protein n=1 Tax=Paramecium tetraurelia TaxID=5888 RepID=A0E1Y4_PARTE|nr:uncharacterized protein GSPATT00022472001 [Paramecium tetraurelia]CAK89301.1 unnamed protein product [Paramecium tetraurelia]|eukprot:XP_001456698.1 hypothetical protein (macronuclear) [Paramecium tetraurelia strain d4-2]